MDAQGGAGLGGEWLLARAAAKGAGVPLPCVESESCLAGGVLISIDGYSASESKPSWLSWEDWGWRAVMAAASDVIASGGVPVAVAVSVGAAEAVTALETVRGAGEATRRLGAVFASGDLNKCMCDAWIDVAVVGRPLRWLTRRGVEPGDYLLQAGYLGYGAIARHILGGRLGPESIPAEVMSVLRRPVPPTLFPTAVGACGARAAVDNSDGWAYTLAQLAYANRLSVEVDVLIVDPNVARMLESLGLNVEEEALASWEDYNIAVAASADEALCLEAECRRLGMPCSIVGRFVEGEPGRVYYRGRPVRAAGWSSF